MMSFSSLFQNNTDANFRTFAKGVFNDFVFMLDDTVHLIKPETLQPLVHTAVYRKLYEF